jgi:hypothetical protein
MRLENTALFVAEVGAITAKTASPSTADIRNLLIAETLTTVSALSSFALHLTINQSQHFIQPFINPLLW